MTIPPEQAYGQKDPTMVQGIPRSNFSGVSDIKVGMQFQARSAAGMRVVTVVGVSDDTITVDANHPLAGVTLNFDVTVVSVREAREEELNHGHVCHGHGEGCGNCH